MWQGRRSLILVLSGPSGVGKTETARRLLQRRKGQLTRSVSATTRPPRPGEVEGVDYYFLERETFERWIQEGRLLEWAEYGGYLYGTPREEVERARAQGLDLLLTIEVQGGAQIRARFPEAVLIFLLPPDWRTLEARLRRRRAEPPEILQQRLDRAREEVRAAAMYDYCVVNEEGNLELTVATVEAILVAERWRLTVREANDFRAGKVLS
ncbi:MAG: guanylate kinase [Candidatus Poribacteria bacterium]|nr:MAG: guanylate kinase [Candidatus Poribacteria bacterium]